MTQDEKVAKAILEVLEDGDPRSTAEIEAFLAERGTECSERAVRVLMLLKHKGKLEGGFSKEKKTWVWNVKG